ncbi:hypothetical protein B0H13DRAFT_2528947 [Mycena leptocephala]|nr:hypothetical protein B0H13DRAFT_2528947 [Mycena leptocephala]
MRSPQNALHLRQVPPPTPPSAPATPPPSPLPPALRFFTPITVVVTPLLDPCSAVAPVIPKRARRGTSPVLTDSRTPQTGERCAVRHSASADAGSPTYTSASSAGEYDPQQRRDSYSSYAGGAYAYRGEYEYADSEHSGVEGESYFLPAVTISPIHLSSLPSCVGCLPDLCTIPYTFAISLYLRDLYTIPSRSPLRRLLPFCGCAIRAAHLLFRVSHFAPPFLSSPVPPNPNADFLCFFFPIGLRALPPQWATPRLGLARPARPAAPPRRPTPIAPPARVLERVRADEPRRPECARGARVGGVPFFSRTGLTPGVPPPSSSASSGHGQQDGLKRSSMQLVPPQPLTYQPYSPPSSSHSHSSAPGVAGGMAQTPGTREAETRELREFWKAYMRTPLTGPAGGDALGLQTPSASSAAAGGCSGLRPRARASRAQTGTGMGMGGGGTGWRVCRA